jgi:hypothetical protein
MNIEKLQKANSNMLACNSCFDAYRESNSQMQSLFDGVKIHRGIDQNILITQILNEIADQLDDIYEGYITLGLVSEDRDPFDEASFQYSKVERKIANHRITSPEGIPENLKPDFPHDQSEFDGYREELIDSDSAWDDIKMAREVLDELFLFLGEAPFGQLLGGSNDNVDNLAENLDDLFVDFIEKAKKIGYFF